MRSFDLEQLDIKGERAVRRDAGQSLAAVGEAGRDGQATLATNGHADNADIPTLDDLALADLEGERLALLVGIKLLAVLELSNVADTDAVAILGNATGSDLAVIDSDALDNFDANSSLGRAGRALLKVLGELNLLGVLLLVGSNSLALVVLELLLLLLGELSVVLCNELVKVLSLRGGALVLALLGGVDQLGGLLLRVKLGDARIFNIVKIVALIILIVFAKSKLELIGGEIVVILIIILVVVVLIVIHNVVTGQVNSVGTRDDKEDLLALVDGDVKRLLVVLQKVSELLVLSV